MALHLIKLCVGVDSVDELVDWRRKRRQREKRCLVYTRNWPRRADEILDGGSLYWVIKGLVRVRQRVKEFHHNLDEEGRAFCTIELEHEPILTETQSWRPFQGWRYLTEEKAPKDVPSGSDYAELPEHMVRELREIGVL